MRRIVCETCRSYDITKLDDNYYQCSDCRVKYTTEQAKKLLVEVSGIQGYDELVNNAETFYELGEYIKASKIFEDISDKYPNKYQGWLGLFKIYFEHIGGRNYDTYYERALKFASAEERIKIRAFYDAKIKKEKERELKWKQEQKEKENQERTNRELYQMYEKQKSALCKQKSEIEKQQREIEKQQRDYDFKAQHSYYYWLSIPFGIGLLGLIISLFFSAVSAMIFGFIFFLSLIWFSKIDSKEKSYGKKIADCKKKIRDYEEEIRDCEEKMRLIPRFPSW